MARGRVITPEFWTDEKVIALTPWARLFYIGLWNFTYCDRGHLPDSAFELKLKVLPGDQVDHKAIVDELIEHGKLERITIADLPFLFMPSFERHQKKDTRWKNPRCPACALQTPPEHIETHPSSGEPEGAQANSHQRGEERTGKERTGENLSSGIAAAIPRPDVEGILDYLDERVVANGTKKPGRNKTNRDAARLLLDVDGKTVDQVRRAIEWATADDFWRVNVRSASALRKHYDALVLAAQRKAKSPEDRHQNNMRVLEGLRGGSQEVLT